jgi:hypothetical protein
MMKSAADVEREVETSRSNLDRTVEALKDKMTPGQLFDEASRALGSTGQQVFSKFVEQAKENPMPLAVMGLGLAWLMSGSGRRSGSGYPVYEPRSFAPGGGNGIAGAAHGIGEKAADLVSGVKDKVAGAKDRLADATGSVGEAGRSAAQSVSAAAQSTLEKADQYRHQAQRSFSQVLEAEPLLIGAIGLAVGAAIGASLPHTDVEDRAVGPLRDKVLEKGKEIAQEDHAAGGRRRPGRLRERQGRARQSRVGRWRSGGPRGQRGEVRRPGCARSAAGPDPGPEPKPDPGPGQRRKPRFRRLELTLTGPAPWRRAERPSAPPPTVRTQLWKPK